MTEQHLHNRIGNAVGECKKRLFVRLKQGVTLEKAIEDFLAEIRDALKNLSS